MASTSDLIRSAAASVKAGKEVTSDSLGVKSSSSDVSSAGSADDTGSVEVFRAEESTVEDGLPVSSEDTPTDLSASEVPKVEAKPEVPKAKQTTSDREVITVTDDKGRRRKVEIDYSNREATKKAFLEAAGFRKMQAERDQALNATKEKDSKISNYDLLEKAWAEGGHEGVVDLLVGRKGAFKDVVRQAKEREKFLETASPEEIQAMQEKEAAEISRRELEKIKQENAEFKKQVTEERETAELKSLESKIHPVFHKYRFADKLGDEVDEHMFDEMLWNTTLKRLEPYEDEGLELSPELIEKEFATVSRAIRKRIGLQAEKKAARTVEQKKQEATENAQASVMSGYTEGGLASEARKLINSGNTKGLMKQWGKYGSLFNKKK